MYRVQKREMQQFWRPGLHFKTFIFKKITAITTVKPRYLATFGPGHNLGERRGWRLNGGSARM